MESRSMQIQSGLCLSLLMAPFNVSSLSSSRVFGKPIQPHFDHWLESYADEKNIRYINEEYMFNS